MNKQKQSKAQKFDELFNRYYKAMMSTALRILGNERDAEDAVQQAGALPPYRQNKGHR